MYNPQRPRAISPPLIVILFKACWATTQLLFLGVDGIEPWAECLIPQFCSCVLGLFCILGDEEEELHGMFSSPYFLSHSQKYSSERSRTGRINFDPTSYISFMSEEDPRRPQIPIQYKVP